MSAQCGSVDDGARCVFGEGHKVDYHSDGNRQWFGSVCDVCGNEASSGCVMSEVEVCRLCYAGVEERSRVREEERDVYRAALADMVAGLDGARARAIDVLGGHPALCGQCPHPPHEGPCLASLDPAGLTEATRDKVCPKVPLGVKDTTAQDLLWEYAQRRRVVDAEFSDDLQDSLLAAGYRHLPGRCLRRVVPCVSDRALQEALTLQTMEENIAHSTGDPDEGT